MNKRRSRALAGLYLLTILFLWVSAGIAQNAGQGTDQNTPTIDEGWRALQALASPATPRTKEQKDTLGAIAAVIGLIGTGVPVLLKAYESIAVRSRTRDLDRIENLVALMKKTRKEQVLGESTVEAVCAQIELEIHAALDGLARSRERRQLVIEKKRMRRNSDLTLVRSALLLFQPHGVRAWGAQLFAFASLFLAFVSLIAIALFISDWPLWLGATIFFVFLFLLARLWALWERGQWQKSQLVSASERPATLFFRPQGRRAWLALLLAYACFILALTSPMAAIANRNWPWLGVMISCLILFSLFRRWALWERQRCQKSQLLPLSLGSA